jgi:hypothetical protein
MPYYSEKTALYAGYQIDTTNGILLGKQIG